MAKSIVTQTLAGNMSDTLFRSWVASVHAILTAGGWVQTSDTGQIDEVTVTNSNLLESRGYSVWRSNDGRAGIDEIYMRIEFWSNTTNVKVFLNITVGFSTNGAGTISSLITAACNLSTNVNHITQYDSYFSAGTGRFSFYSGQSSQNMYFFLERSRDNAGEEENSIVVFYGKWSGSQSNSSVVISPTINYGVVTPNIFAPATTPGIRNGRAGYGFGFGVKGRFTNPLLTALFMACRSAVTPALGSNFDEVQLRNYGTTHNYLIYPSDSNSYALAGNTINTLMLWE